MTMASCAREKEVRALVLGGQWPAACPAELREHVQRCQTCAEIALVMEAFRGARGASLQAASPVPAGVLWWRAQLRRRRQAVERIGQPILGAQIFSFSIILAIAVVLALSQARRGAPWLDWFAQLGHSMTTGFADLRSSTATMPLWGVLLAGCGLVAVAVFSGVVLLLDRRRESSRS
jgi:hypothetical protein